jgi:rhamnosyltransferase
MVSIIIRNRNEEEYIGFAIQSCIDHFSKPEIIIVDNNSTDGSLEIVNMFREKVNIKIININDYSPGKSINLGVKHCTYDEILILSAHAQITEMNYGLVKKRLKDYVAVFGNQTPIYKGKKINKRYIWSHFTNKEIVNLHSDIEDRPFLHNAFCFYLKATLEIHPFDETLSGKEDRYWAIEAIKNKYQYIYTPTIEANHFYTGNGATWKGLG